MLKLYIIWIGIDRVNYKTNPGRIQNNLFEHLI